MTPVAFLLLAIVNADLPAARIEDPVVVIREGVGLLGEGDRLADKGEYTEAVIRYKRGMERLLPGLRKIPFKHEVKRDVTRRENMKEMILKDIDQSMTPEEFRANEVAMKLFGLLPADFKLRDMLAQIYSEEVAAFYDPKTKTMHLIEEQKPREKPRPGFFERLLGARNEFDKDENKTVIAHELTHALADQNFDIDAMQEAVKKDDDQTLALQALIEGEATLAMFGASMNDWTGEAITRLPARNLESTFNLLSAFLPMMGGGKTLRSAPPILVESMVFPYLRGMVFCAELTNRRGWAGVDEAYTTPPLSTEQILHPEKYRDKPDSPMVIDLGKLTPGTGWKELGRNVLGEMQLAVLLRKDGGKPAAAGWDGDRYATFEHAAQKRFGLVWYSTWDSEEDAREFQRAYARNQSSKIDGLAPIPRPLPESLWRDLNDRSYVVERRGSDVVVIEGFTPAVTATLVQQAFAATRSEAKPRTNPHAAKPQPKENERVRTEP